MPHHPRHCFHLNHLVEWERPVRSYRQEVNSCCPLRLRLLLELAIRCFLCS